MKLHLLTSEYELLAKTAYRKFFDMPWERLSKDTQHRWIDAVRAGVEKVDLHRRMGVGCAAPQPEGSVTYRQGRRLSGE